MEHVEFIHHITQAKIVGYGWDDFAKNYNVHTINQTAERDAKHMIGKSIGSLGEWQSHVQKMNKPVKAEKVEVQTIEKVVKASAKIPSTVTKIGVPAAKTPVKRKK